MTLTYTRAEHKTKTWDDVYSCWRFSKNVRLTIQRDGQDIGTVATSIDWSEFMRYRRLTRGGVFRHDWQVTIQGCEWTIPGLRTRSEVLAEIKHVLEGK